MPMAKMNPTGLYQNFFLTVPDRGFTKDDLVRWVDTWRSDYHFMEVVREPYAKPEAGYTHHYHVGMVFPKRVKFLKFLKASHKSKWFAGMDFRIPLVKKGMDARHIFTKYFKDPSKYKALDEHPLLVRDVPPFPRPTEEMRRIPMYRWVYDLQELQSQSTFCAMLVHPDWGRRKAVWKALV